MAIVPNNYPGGCTDEQIFSAVNELSKDIIDSKGNINVVLRLSPIIALGQSELQKRILEQNRSITRDLHAEVKRLSDVVDENLASSKKYARASKLISFVALFLSIISIIISIYFSLQSNQETRDWRRDEINLLQGILDK